ncbi:hypothetical protein ACFQ3S_12260 [Mucilaginibacter terrae]|uniref:hypothetical protein n=1 Tax=Mucilaginibacter terrae TaxID=1955052 RepID=UPI00364324ED
MIIYNKTWLNNLQLHNQFEKDEDTGCLTEAEVKLLKEKYPVGFYMPGIVIRIGLFILTVIIVTFSVGLVSLFLAEARVIDNFGWPLVLGVAGYFLLEYMVKQNRYYQSGVDEALLWITAGLLTGGFNWMLFTIDDKQSYHIPISAFVLVLSSYLTLRFADLLMSAIACLSSLALVFFIWNKFGSFGMATMPFIMMIASAAIYYAAIKLSEIPEAIHYDRCLSIAQILTLITLYLSGNYYVVQALSTELTGAPPGTPVPFGYIFWACTMLFPFAYLYIGLKNKNLILIRTGLLLIAGAIFTFRNYYHVLPLEVAFAIGGCALLAISYAIIKYLKTPKHGFTYTAINRKNLLDHLNVESLVIGETFANTSNTPAGPESPFGGGNSAGGGSSSAY